MVRNNWLVFVPDGMSSSEKKTVLYRVDTYFREALEELQDKWNGQILQKLFPVASIVFKPDAIVSRKILPSLDYLARHGFVPLGFKAFRYNRHIIREDWRYQFNVASRARIAVVDVLLSATDSLFVLLHDKTSAHISAAMRLKQLKGPCEPTRRVPGQLRYELGVRNTLLNYIHTADDPADIVRSFGVYFSSDTRSELHSAIDESADVTKALEDYVKRMYGIFAEQDIDFERCMARVEEAISTSRRGDVDYLMARCRDLRDRRGNDWQTFFQQLSESGVEVSLWDFIVSATELTDCNMPDTEPLI
jgi:hypothetical protein